MSKETGLFEEIGDAVTPEVKKIVPKKKPAIKAGAIKPKQEIAIQSETSALLKLAIDKDLDVNKLEKLIELKVKEEARQCKKDFDLHFAEMQKEFNPIVRSKKGDKGMYAPVDVIIKQYGPIIAKHNFLFSWDEIQLEDKSLKVILTISGYGHEKINSKILPEYIPDKGNQSGKYIMNALQAEGVRSTYGYRYTFKAGFGLTETDEDTDGYLTFNDGIEYAEQIVWLKSCNSREDLLSVFKKIVETLKKNNDTIGKGVLTEVYTDMKKELK